MNDISSDNGHLAAEQRNALIDGELSPSEVKEVERHLAQCHPCALAVLAASQLKAATARAGRRYAASPETLGRLAAQLRPPAPKQFERRSLFAAGRPGYLAWGALAASLLLVVSLVSWRQVRQTNALWQNCWISTWLPCRAALRLRSCQPIATRRAVVSRQASLQLQLA